jgi:hypothetical protein
MFSVFYERRQKLRNDMAAERRKESRQRERAVDTVFVLRFGNANEICDTDYQLMRLGEHNLLKGGIN